MSPSCPELLSEWWLQVSRRSCLRQVAESAFRTLIVTGAFSLAWMSATMPTSAQVPTVLLAASPEQDRSDLARHRLEIDRADPLRDLDVNNDGKLDAAEVESAAVARFDELDTSQDNTLTEREASPALQVEAFRRIDTNRNGTVNKAEYLAHIERAFDYANPDQNGMLEGAELETVAGQALLKLLRHLQ